MDWYGNEDDEGALQRRYQGQGGRLEAIRGDLTLAELSAKHGVDRTTIAARKRQAIDGMVGTFSGAGDAVRGVSESEVEKLHAKIGQLVVERDFLSESHRSMGVDRRRAMVEPAHHHLSITTQCSLPCPVAKSAHPAHPAAPESASRCGCLVLAKLDCSSTVGTLRRRQGSEA